MSLHKVICSHPTEAADFIQKCNQQQNWICKLLIFCALRARNQQWTCQIQGNIKKPLRYLDQEERSKNLGTFCILRNKGNTIAAPLCMTFI